MGRDIKSGTRILKHMKAKLIQTEKVQPQFHRAWPDPYSIHSKVDAELECLEREAILRKVAWSEWGTPILPIVKKCSAESVCGDFKGQHKPCTESWNLAPALNWRHFCYTGRGTMIQENWFVTDLPTSGSWGRIWTILYNQDTKGLYQYNKLVFGVTSFPAIWQWAVDQV